MADLSKLCFGCMHELPDGATECPHCKFDNTRQNNAEFLPIKAVLSERYVVGKVLSVNGEGVTYIGYDKELNIPVRIREYYPAGLCTRAGNSVEAKPEAYIVYKTEMAEFLKLARNLARMRSLSALLPVYDIFEENETAYYISETVESITLRDFLIRNGGALTFDQLRPLFMPLMQTLSSLHAVDIIHRGISPDTLIIGKDGKMRLTEFCVPAARTARSDMAAQLFKGYAAIEQYGFDGEQGPWTDVYGLAATIYRSLVGSPPPEATARVTNDKMIIPASVADSLSAYVMTGLANALQILPNERTESIETFRDEISATPTVVTKAAARSKANSESNGNQKNDKTKSGGKKNYVVISMLITIVALVLIFVLVYFGLFRSNNNPEVPETTAVTTTEPYSENIIDPDAGTAPDLLRKTYADVLDSTDSEIVKAVENYKIVIKSKEYSDQDEGIILSQTPKPGESIRKGDTITVVISLGQFEFDMPDVIGLSEDKAYIKLLEAGFNKNNISWEKKYSTSVDPGAVVDITPDKGEKVNADMHVTVYINSYKPETTKSFYQENPNENTAE